jgi:hypothetical protein
MQGEDTLKPVDAASLAAFEAAESEIVTRTVRRAVEEADLPAELLAEMTRKFTVGLQMTSEMLRSIMAVGGTELLRDQIEWAERRLPHEGITPEMLRRHFLLYKDVLEGTLEPSHASGIIPYLDYLIRE